MNKIIIQICPVEGSAMACLMSGEAITEDSDVYQDMMDCNSSGDVSDACDYVVEKVGVEFRIVAKDEQGNYENRLATDEEKSDTCRNIYFESETDFDDQRSAEQYLVWQAAIDLED